MPSTDLEDRVSRTSTKPADQAGTQDDDWERNGEKEDQHERGRRQRAHDIILERPASDPRDRLKNDGEDRRFQAEEDRRHDAEPAIEDVNPAQRHDRQ